MRGKFSFLQKKSRWNEDEQIILAFFFSSLLLSFALSLSFPLSLRRFFFSRIDFHSTDCNLSQYTLLYTSIPSDWNCSSEKWNESPGFLKKNRLKSKHAYHIIRRIFEADSVHIHWVDNVPFEKFNEFGSLFNCQVNPKLYFLINI